MAQGRIAQKQAVAFGYLAQLLLQTVPGVRAEYVASFGYRAWEQKLKRSLAPSQNPNENENPGPEPAPSGSAQSPHDPVTSPDYGSLLSRSRDLFDGKYDATPEGRREANALETELELMKPPASKPPRGLRARAIELVKRFQAQQAPAAKTPSTALANQSPPPIAPAAPSELPATRRPETQAGLSQTFAELPEPNKLSSPPPSPAPAAPEIKPRGDHFVAPPSRRHAEPEFPITRVDWLPPAPKFKPKGSVRMDKLQRELRTMSNYRMRHLQHLNSRGF